MVSSLLITKLHLPSLRSLLVQRNHLLAKLNQGLTSKLILISAAAGFGKTTVLKGNLDEAIALVQNSGLSVEGELQYSPTEHFPKSSELNYLTYSRVLLAYGQQTWKYCII